MTQDSISEPEIKVYGHGSEQAKIVFVGDYASEKDVGTGKALTDYSGDLLERLLRSQRLQLRSPYVYRTLAYKEHIKQLGYQKTKDRETLAELYIRRPLYRDLLIEEINAIRPNVIVPMGELALNMVCGEKHIFKFRGSVLPISNELAPRINGFERIKCIPLVHPRDIYKDWTIYAYTQLDISKIIANMDNTDPIRFEYNIWVCRDPNHLNNYLIRSTRCDFAVTDIETHYGFVTCIGLCFDGHEAISIPILEDKMPLLTRWSLVKILNKLFKRKDIKWVNQNVGYDDEILKRYGLQAANVYGDTMLFAHTLYPEFPKGLDFLNSIYTDIPYYKDEGKEFDPKLHTMDQLYLYNAKDCLSTHIIFNKQIEDAKAISSDYAKNDCNLHAFFFNRHGEDTTRTPEGVMPLYHAYQKVQRRGILVDEIQRCILKEKYGQLLVEKQEDLTKQVGHEFNPNSSKQCGEVIYVELKCPKHTHLTDAGERAWDCDEDTLEEMCVKQLHEVKDAERISILRNIVYARKLDKILGYLDSVYHPDGRMRTRVKISGTDSGRTSGGTTNDRLLCMGGLDIRRADYELDNKIANGKLYELPKNRRKGIGVPFQTIPKHGFEIDSATTLGNDIISMYIPTPGYTFVEGDLSQAEARRVAVLAEDWEILPIFDKPPGIHRLTASWIYDCDPFSITKKDPRYDIGKRARHAGNYDMGDYRLAVMAHIPAYEAQTILRKFHAANPNIRNIFHLTVRTIIQQSRVLITPYGRRREFFGKIDDHAIKSAYSYDPQSTISDHNKFAMLRIMDRCERRDLEAAYILAETHDSVFAEVRHDFVSEYCEIFKQEMEQPIDCRNGTIKRDYQLVIPTEIKTSKTNWLEMAAWIV